MKSKKFKLKLFLTLILTSGLLIGACAKSAKYESVETARDYDSSGSYDDSEDFVSSEKGEKEASPGSVATNTGSTGLLDDGLSSANDMEKIIRIVNLEVETLEFNDFINSIENKISSLGGYIESADISGRRFDYGNRNRYGNIIARIPKNKLDAFVDHVDDNSNVVNRSQSTENVTLDYVDTESRKKALEIEQERVFELLEKADSIDMIITLESRLTSIRYELQNYETKLRTIDNKVDYSTVTIDVYEVQRITPEIVEKPTVLSRIKTGFSETIYDLSEGFKDFFVWFVVNLPYIIIWAIIIVVAIVVGRKIYFRINKKKDIRLVGDDKDSKLDGPNDEL